MRSVNLKSVIVITKDSLGVPVGLLNYGVGGSALSIEAESSGGYWWCGIRSTKTPGNVEYHLNNTET